MEDLGPLGISQMRRFQRGGWTNRRGFRDQLRAFGLQDRRAENRFRDQSIPQELTGYWRCPEQGGFVRACSDVTNPLFSHLASLPRRYDSERIGKSGCKPSAFRAS